MKIVQVHNRYKIRGGEWTVFNHEKELLSREHEVDTIVVDNREKLRSVLDKANLIFTTHYNRESRRWVREQLLQKRPDIMHVHNFFPLLTPSIFDAARDAAVPSVMTLHNYRLIHPNGYLLHNGKIDERSVTGSAWSCVPDRVYRDSLFQTAVVAHMIEYHRKKETWKKKVDAFICLTEFAKKKFIEGGLPPDKLKVKPNFVMDSLKELYGGVPNGNRESFYLFVGRISEEKGIRTLIRAWKKLGASSRFKLVILGEGPLKSELEHSSHDMKNISWVGVAERSVVMEYLWKARALIFPSEWYEGMPMTILESFCMGTPVISSDIGSQKEIVTDHQTGLHFKKGSVESMIEAITLMDQKEELREDLGQAARKEYEMKYTPEVNYGKLLSIYEELLEGKHN